MSIRCFIGLPLPESYQDRLEEISKKWKGRLRSRLTWTKPGNWHMTLKFLGSVAEEAVASVVSALEGVEQQPFSFQGGGAGTFPPRKRPRVLWIGAAKGGHESRLLAGEVEQALEPIGFERDKRPFSPHLTLARVRVSRADQWDELLEELVRIQWPELSMDRFVLWQSELTPKGPVYSVIREFELGSQVSGK